MHKIRRLGHRPVTPAISKNMSSQPLKIKNKNSGLKFKKKNFRAGGKKY
jgi:hypothetical protein